MHNNAIILLNTRPQPTNNELSELLQVELGIQVLQLPTITIQPVTSYLDEPVDYLIFTSANAVLHSQASLIEDKDTIPVIAIGEKTKATLQQLGWKNILTPSVANSEAVIAIHDINNKKIAIVTGEDGRALLYEQLSQKGAVITELFCYKRVMPQRIDQSIVKKIEVENIAIVLITSIACYDNLCTILGDAVTKLQKSSLWLVFSDRIKTHMENDIAQSQIYVCEPNQAAIIAKVKMICKDLTDER